MHWKKKFDQFRRFVVKSMSLIKDDGNGNGNVKDNDLIGWMKKSNRAARAARN